MPEWRRAEKMLSHSFEGVANGCFERIGAQVFAHSDLSGLLLRQFLFSLDLSPVHGDSAYTTAAGLLSKKRKAARKYIDPSAQPGDFFMPFTKPQIPPLDQSHFGEGAGIAGWDWQPISAIPFRNVRYLPDAPRL